MSNSRNVFAFDGLLGFVIAVLVLLAALGILTFFAIGSQNHNATNYYYIKNEKSIKMFDVNNAKHVVTVKGVENG